jgi:phage terminase large subunit-like protein
LQNYVEVNPAIGLTLLIEGNEPTKKPSNTMTIEIKYTASVYTPAGWRGVTIKAIATKTSEKMALVVEVLEIDGESPKSNMSRTGASRQRYNGSSISCREVGAKKRLSACEIVN